MSDGKKQKPLSAAKLYSFYNYFKQVVGDGNDGNTVPNAAFS